MPALPSLPSDEPTYLLVSSFIKDIRSLLTYSDLNVDATVAAKVSTICSSYIHHQSIPALFPPQNAYHSVVSAASNVLLSSLNMTGSEGNGWTFQSEKDGLLRHRKNPKDSPFSLFRGESVLEYPQNVLLHAIRSKEVQISVSDGQMIDCGPLEVVDAHCTVKFEEYRSPAPLINAREFVYIDVLHRLSDGTILSFGSSVEHEARPRSDEWTRSELQIGGWALEPIPNEPGKTKVVFVVQCALGGWVPGWIMNKITSNIPMSIRRLDQALKAMDDIGRFDQPLMDVLL